MTTWSVPAVVVHNRAAVPLEYDLRLSVRNPVFYILVFAIMAAMTAWDWRYDVDPDGIAYLDMASAAQHNIGSLVHLYWSPLYPGLLAVFMAILHPSPHWEFPMLHLVNWCIFLAAMASFTFFFRQWTDREARNSIGITVFAYAVAYWATADVVPVSRSTPDLCVAVIVYLAAGFCCQISRPGARWKSYGALGVVLGLGYYAKGAMLPIGFTLLVILFLFPPKPDVRRSGILLSALCLALTVAPLVIGISQLAGRFSVGEVARLNWVWHTNGVPSVGWIGQPPGGGTPLHPPRTLQQHPLTLEFNGPVGGTYPLWYDPAYWNAGVQVRFDPAESLAAFRKNLNFYARNIVTLGPLAGGIVALWLLTSRKKRRVSVGNAWMFLWPLVVFVVYGLVWVETRYLGPFVLLFWLALYGALRRLGPSRVQEIVLITVALAMLFSAAVNFSLQLYRVGLDAAGGGLPHDQLAAADALTRAGVHSGDLIAGVGYSFDSEYARLARVRLVAQVMDAEDFWRMDSGELQGLLAKLKQAGIRAVVAMHKPNWVEGWQQLGPTNLWVRLL